MLLLQYKRLLCSRRLSWCETHNRVYWGFIFVVWLSCPLGIISWLYHISVYYVSFFQCKLQSVLEYVYIFRPSETCRIWTETILRWCNFPPAVYRCLLPPQSTHPYINYHQREHMDGFHSIFNRCHSIDLCSVSGRKSCIMFVIFPLITIHFNEHWKIEKKQRQLLHNIKEMITKSHVLHLKIFF